MLEVHLIRDAGDIVDRFAVAQLKVERIGSSESKREFRCYFDELFTLFLMHPHLQWWSFIMESLHYNSSIWDLESAVRKGLLDGKPKEVGRRAIEIRKLNQLRIGVKNRVNSLVRDGFVEEKKDHISEIK